MLTVYSNTPKLAEEPGCSQSLGVFFFGFQLQTKGWVAGSGMAALRD